MSLRQQEFESFARTEDTVNDTQDRENIFYDMGGPSGGYTGGNNGNTQTLNNTSSDTTLDDLTLDDSKSIEFTGNKNEGVEFESGPAIGNTSVVDYSVDDEFDLYLIGVPNGREDFDSNLLTAIFDLPHIQAQSIYDNYKGSTSILGGKGYWVNTIRFSKLLDGVAINSQLQLKKIYPTQDTISDDVTGHDWELIYGEETNPPFKAILRFIRPYVYNGTKVNNGSTINPTKWRDVSLSFNVTSETAKYSISYVDMNGFLWFRVSSYFKIKSIRINGIVNPTKQTPIYIDDTLYGDSTNDKPTFDDNIYNATLLTSFINNQYTYRYNNHIVQNLNTELYNSINSEKYFSITNVDESDEIFGAKTYEFKVYLGNIVRDWKAIEGNENKKYEIQVFIDLSETFTVDSEDPVFKAYSNTRSSVLWVNKEYILHDTFPVSSKNNTETPTEQNTSSDTPKTNCVAIFQRNQGESSFGGSISMFYGNQYIYPETISTTNINGTITKTNVKANGDQYTNNSEALYYYTETKDDKLYVYVKTIGDKNIYLHRFVSIYLSDNSKSQYSSGIGNTSLSSRIAQDSVVVHSVDISVPQVTAADELVWIDDSFNNKTKHYTYYTELETSPGVFTHYGVRAIAVRGTENEDGTVSDNKHFNNNIYGIGIDGLSYNVPATIVKLIPRKEQQNIYSFKDGNELVLLNPANTGARLEGTKWTGYEILPSFTLSYEYIIDKTHFTPDNDDYNFRFYPGKAFAYWTVENAYSSNAKYISVSYTYTEQLPNATYSKVTNLNRMRPSNEVAYTPSFSQYTGSDDENRYSQVVEYVKVSANSVSFDYFKEVVNKETVTGSDGTELFYKYSTVTNNYVRYINEDISNMSSTPLNLYVKTIYYIKTPKTVHSTNNEGYYKKDFSYTSFTSTKSSVKDKLYDLISNNTYQLIANTYVPITGFIRDGSAPYYGYRLVPLSDADYTNSNPFAIDGVSDITSSVFVRSTFMEMFENDVQPTDPEEIKNLIGKYKVNNIPIYKRDKNNIINYLPITKLDSTIYDIDLTGNTIYSYTETAEGIFDINTIRNKMQNVEWTNTDADRDNIIRNENSSYRLTNFEIDEAGHKISYIVSLAGLYEEVEYTKAEDDLIKNASLQPEDRQVFYTKDDEYHYHQYKGANASMLTTLLNALSNYNVDNYIFIKAFGKLTTDFLNDYNRKAFIVPVGSGKQNEGPVYYKLNGNYYGIYTYLETSGEFKYTGLLNSSTAISQLNVLPGAYKYSEDYVDSHDIYYSINKEYYSKQTSKTTLSYLYEPITYFTVTNGVIQSIPKLERPGYKYNPEDIRYYTANISYYSYYDSPSMKIVNVNGDPNFNKNLLTDLPTNGREGYTNNIYFKTKYFYPEYTYNDGIHVDVSGSYYTNLYVYDGKTGSRIRKMLLNNYKYDISKYSYELTTSSQFELDKDSLPENISIHDYKKYYIRFEDFDGNAVEEQLNESSDTPAYYLSNPSYSLFTYINIVSSYEYNAIGDYQLAYHKQPVVIEMNNEFYGLIFKNKISYEVNSPFITFKDNYEQLDDDQFVTINSSNVTTFNDFQIDENDVGGSNGETYSRALDSMNDELYYNDYSGRDVSELTYGVANFVPENYLYEIVQLSRFTFRHYDGDRSIVQAKSVITENIVSTIPFSISNAEELHFPGTYTWVPPQYKTIANVDGTQKIVISRDGYWKKDYKIEKKPFSIASYNYYPKEEVNMVNISYNYMPYSYIVTAEINHPTISYETLATNIREEIRYSYILNGFEFDYPSSSPLIEKNGSYYGLSYIYDMDNTYVSMQVPLYKKNAIVATPVIESYELQPEHVSYSYFAYIQATPLTNEKVPVLYNTELMPASTRKVQYWDSFKNSYAIKTVIDSYAYYSYKYIYETIPFKVASYIFTEDLGISNFPVLGAYIDNITYTLDKALGKQSEALTGLTGTTSDLLKEKIDQDEKWYDVHNNTFKSYTTQLTNTVSNLDTNTNTSLSYLSTSLSDKFTVLTNKEEAAINSLSENAVKVITTQHNIIKDGLTHNADVINERFTSFENKYHNDVIGNAALENIPTTYERVTYKPIVNGPSGLVSGYSYVRETGQQTVKAGGSSLGEILKNSLGSMMDYTKTDVHEDGSYTVTTYKGFMGIANILANLSINKKLPDYNEFMVDLTPKLFSAIDFEGDYDIEYDINGQIKSKKKRNPTDLAKKCIMRADILWNELKKKGIVS